MTTQLEFRMLGPLEVIAAGQPIDLGPARQRALLAVLLVQANWVVSTDRLLDDLWGDSPPTSAAHALQVYVSNLRKLLEPGRPPGSPGECLVTRRPGYMLAVPPERVDASCFEAGAATGRRALAESRPDAAAAALRAALDRWKGPALADLADQAFCRTEAGRLEELRLGATEDRVEADLALGLHGELVGELEVLVERHPLRERLWAHLLIALYRCGRQADALRAYQRVRTVLGEELGLEPGAALRRVEQAILRQDDDLEFRPAPIPPSEPVIEEESSPAVASAPEPRGDWGPRRPERRNLTALSVELCGHDQARQQVDRDELRLVMEGAASIVCDAFEDYGGTVTSQSGGELLGLFGVPGAHEDDAERAIRAGLRIVEEIRSFGVDVARGWGVEPLGAKVGVNTGPAVVEPGTGDPVGGCAATGHAITAAARLVSRARPGCVLVAESTRRLADPLFEWGDVRHLVIAGDQLVASEATAPRTVSGSICRLEEGDVELVGREQEVAAGSDAVDAVLGGAGGVLFVTGEAGIGKSRLLGELRRRFEATGSAGGDPLWLEGRCVSFGQSLPYGPFRGMLREWLGTSPHQPQLRTRVGLRRQVEALFGEEADRLQPLLATVLGLPLERDASESLKHRAPDSLQAAIFDAVEALVGRLARDRPVVVAVDDTQWADPTSLQLLEHLLATTETAAVLVVLVGRPERDHPSWRLKEFAARHFGHRTHDIALEALTGDASARMLDSLPGMSDVPDAVARRVLEVAEGNPFFIEELATSLVEGGFPGGTDDGWRWEGDAVVDVPRTVETVLIARIDRLPPVSREVLTAASVVGRQFGVELIEAVCDAGTDVTGALRELGRLDLVREVRRWPRREYRFKHALIQQAAYGMLMEDWRRELHRRTAHGIETIMADRVAESYALLAHHCVQAGEIPRATAYFRLAGDGARRLHAVEEAIEHYSCGIDLATLLAEPLDLATAAGLHLGRGQVLWQRGDERAEADFEAALLASRRIGDRTTELDALEGLGLVEAFLHGRRDHAVARFERAFSLAQECRHDMAAVTFANRLTIELANRLEFDRALEWGEVAMAAATRAGTDRARARAMDGRKLVATALGDFSTLRELTSNLERILVAQDDLWYLKFALAEASVEAAGRGRFAEASDRLADALAVNERLGNRVDAPYFVTLQARMERSRGGYGLALILAREAVMLACEHSRGMWQAWAEADLGVIYLELGSLASAIAHLERGREAADRAGVGTQYVRCCSHLAWSYWRSGDEVRSAELLAEAEDLLGRVNVPPGAAWLEGADAYLSVARTRRARSEGNRASELLKPLLAPAQASGWYEAISSVSLALAASSALEPAEPLLRQALESAQLGGLRPLEWQTHRALAEGLRVRGEEREADQHIRQASLISSEIAKSIDDPAIRESFLTETP